MIHEIQSQLLFELFTFNGHQCKRHDKQQIETNKQIKRHDKQQIQNNKQIYTALTFYTVLKFVHFC